MEKNDGYKSMEKKYIERAKNYLYIHTYTEIQNLCICICMHTNMKKRKNKEKGGGLFLNIRKLFIKSRRIYKVSSLKMIRFSSDFLTGRKTAGIYFSQSATVK